MDSTHITNLGELAQGESAYIFRLPHYRGIQRKLISLGLVPGTEVTFVRGGNLQPMVLEREGCQVVLGRELASIIQISFTKPDDKDLDDFNHTCRRLFSPLDHGHRRNRHFAGANRYGH